MSSELNTLESDFLKDHYKANFKGKEICEQMYNYDPAASREYRKASKNNNRRSASVFCPVLIRQGHVALSG